MVYHSHQQDQALRHHAHYTPVAYITTIGSDAGVYQLS